MVTEAAFLKAIREEPTEDAHRLAFADWLIDNGNPRGEFIAVQCELARLADDDPRRFDLRVREQVLLHRHEKDWTVRPFIAWLKHPKRACRNPEGHHFCQIMAKGLAANCDLACLPPDDPGRERLQKIISSCEKKMESETGYMPATCTAPLFQSCVFHRGFIDEVTVEDYIVYLFAEAIFDLAWPCKLVVEWESMQEMGDEAIRGLLRVADRCRLRSLDLGVTPDELEPIEELATSPLLANLDWLHLMLPDDSQDEAARSLAASPHLQNLRCLELSSVRPGDALLQAILDSPHLSRLERLAFDYDYDGNVFSPALLRRAEQRFGSYLVDAGVHHTVFQPRDPGQA